MTIFVRKEGLSAILAVAVAGLVALGALVTAGRAEAATQGDQIVQVAASQAGAPYCFAGGDRSGPTHGTGGPGCPGSTRGYDCSGLALYAVYRVTGILLPHGLGMQSGHGGTPVSRSDLQPGDLVFFGPSLANFSHVGIYAGGGKMWDAADYGVPVQLHPLYSNYVGAVRYWRGGAGGSSFAVAFQANNGYLYTYNSSSGPANWGQGMKAGTSPSIARLASGGWETSFQANTGSLFAYGDAYRGNFGQGMKAGTSPSIAALAGGGFEMAFQANTGNLIVVGDGGWVNTGQGMMAGTSPSIAASSRGGFQVAFQANNGNLYIYNSARGPANLGQGMKAGTSPDIAALPGGGYEMAFQANTGALVAVGDAGGVNTGQGMMAGTSPAIDASPNGGGFQAAFQANNGNLYIYNSARGPANLGQGMKAGTSPDIAALPGGGYEMAFQANTGALVAVGDAGGVNTGQGMMAGTSPSIDG